jgi:hypothetical protein
MLRKFQLAFNSNFLTLIRAAFTPIAFTALFVTASYLIISTSAHAQYATIGPNGGVVILNAPPVAFTSVAPGQPRAGISLADRAGISNNWPETEEVAIIGSAGALYNGAAIANGAAIPYNGAAVSTEEVASGNNAGQTTETRTRTRRDLGNSVFVGEGPVGGAIRPSGGAPSLAEVAAKLKTNRVQSKRVYTNADAQHINDNLKIRGTNRPLNPQSNTPPPPK